MELISVGKISGTHHLMGTVKVSSNFEDLSVIVGSKVIIKNTSGMSRILTVTNIKKISPKRLAFDFEEITNKTEGTALSGYSIYVRKDILGLEEDEYYASDIIGMMAVTVEGEELGEITDLMETAGHDIYIIGKGKEEIMVPSVDEFVKDIDFEKRVVTFDLIEGMRP
ncbi:MULTISPECIES: ribosome maturation factor RimM [Psychrilyobacter]|uniref:Ribosome maturation factor RimM n=1 Tax=Psychrilyobacter piezotolerans TaxID=2293438 RepID=A0ABX9KI15_9FUSO|nr:MULTISPECIES: ribosome maturation factor RimM [Psychrilyobacter]MCS5421464.1 ribosome maturation factor RimM [Psychrilyobacter sp. S5]NDI77784.1 16S rRNA processing protein RimM [Psychrilyobacter piezotolerans]RDE62362.1 16S rRNA processing protein RimM [Psychrilyobacter sp. S5]REI41460.1 16S rRNA processing protein RimM [Psychrilyobacter piezotolerans]